MLLLLLLLLLLFMWRVLSLHVLCLRRAVLLLWIFERELSSVGLTIVLSLLGFGDAERRPDEFPIAPADAIPRALRTAGLQVNDVNVFEINEAFASVCLANMQLLNIDAAKLNVYGGAIALGHPIGSSGARIIGTMMTALRNRNETIGCASICNGGGGASAIVIERLA